MQQHDCIWYVPRLCRAGVSLISWHSARFVLPEQELSPLLGAVNIYIILLLYGRQAQSGYLCILREALLTSFLAMPSTSAHKLSTGCPHNRSSPLRIICRCTLHLHSEALTRSAASICWSFCETIADIMGFYMYMIIIYMMLVDVAASFGF